MKFLQLDLIHKTTPMKISVLSQSRKMHDSFQIPLNTTTIKATPIQRNRFDSIIYCLSIDRICKLYFLPRPSGLSTQNIENIRCQNISANAGKIRRGFV